MSRRQMAADIAALQRLAHQHRTEVDRVTRERDAWAARCADAEDTVRSLRDLLARNDSVAVTGLRRVRRRLALRHRPRHRQGVGDNR